MRAAVTALAWEAANDAQQQTGQEKEGTEDAVESLWRSPARYLWAMLLARIYESTPLVCPVCSADMRIIAFVTDGVSVRGILEHTDEPAQPPPVAPARPCATPLRCAILLRLRTGPNHPWLGRSLLERSLPCFACVPAQALQGLGVRCSIAAHPPAWEEEAEPLPLLDSLAQPEPDFQFDQTVSW